MNLLLAPGQRIDFSLSLLPHYFGTTSVLIYRTEITMQSMLSYMYIHPLFLYHKDKVMSDPKVSGIYTETVSIVES